MRDNLFREEKAVCTVKLMQIERMLNREKEVYVTILMQRYKKYLRYGFLLIFILFIKIKMRVSDVFFPAA